MNFNFLDLPEDIHLEICVHVGPSGLLALKQVRDTQPLFGLPRSDYSFLLLTRRHVVFSTRWVARITCGIK